jgi:hypothetical protein
MAKITKADKAIRELKAAKNAICNNGNANNSYSQNNHLEVLDTGSETLVGVANYSYIVISGTAEVTINGNTIQNIPTGFMARQGDTTPSSLVNNITITGESLGTRIIVYYEQ